MVLFSEPVRKLEHAGVLRDSRSSCGPWGGSGTFVSCVHIPAGGLAERAQGATVWFRGLDDDWQRRIAVAQPQRSVSNRSCTAQRLFEDAQDRQHFVCGERCALSYRGLVCFCTALAQCRCLEPK